MIVHMMKQRNDVILNGKEKPVMHEGESRRVL